MTEPPQNLSNSCTECNEKPSEATSQEQTLTLPEHRNGTAEHQMGAHLVRETPSVDPDLVLLLDRWPTLPEHIKAAIKALVQSASKEGAVE